MGFISLLPLSWKEYQALSVIHYGHDGPQAILDENKRITILEMRKDNTIQQEEHVEPLRAQVQHLKPDRAEKLMERAAVANYLILPTKYSFPTLVRLYALVYTFVNKLCRNRRILNHLLKESKIKFQMFQSSTGPSPTIAMTVGREK